jgi:FkbM family methyltransferase
MLHRCRKLLRYLNLMGAAEGVHWAAIRVGNRYNLVSRTTRVQKAPGTLYPVTMRVGGSSDPMNFDQIFIDAYLADFTSRVRCARVIVDLGAYVGYASVFFLNAFPDAFVLAVEPDPQNAEICARNLAPYGGRARLVKAAVWNNPGRLVLSRGAFRDGKEWTSQARPAQSDETADVEAVDVLSLLQMCPQPIIDILKIDIEGAEAVLFGAGAEGWLKCVRNICVEIHSEEAASIIDQSLQSFRFESIQSGEYNVYLNLTKNPQRAPRPMKRPKAQANHC